ncbi:eCIS core domain-containing protein [Streptomyces pyxinicus]|uniref:eCIS core domain-containing protein n=1 Tax=Streptomyces pyxinicus TaxID=2970331 RepID=UPI003D172282
MESRFGTDFGDVRLHTGPARCCPARAVTPEQKPGCAASGLIRSIRFSSSTLS